MISLQALSSSFHKVFLILLCAATALSLDTYYTIFPKSNDDIATNERITQDIYGRIDPTTIHHSQSAFLGTMYWYAPLNNDNLARYRNDAGVRSVAQSGDQDPPTRVKKDSNGTLKGRAITSQKPAPSSLRMITQADGQTEFPDGYYYDESAGKDIRIYVIDSGVQPDHEEFARVDVSWRFSGPFGPTNEADDTPSDSGHGTCMASCALGIKKGIAKKSKLTMVRASAEKHQGQDIMIERYIDSLAQVYDAIKNGNEQGKAVVSMSWGYDPPQKPEYRDPAHDTFVKLLDGIINDLDAPALAAAGNLAFLDEEVSTVPAILGETDVPNLIVIGAVDYDGVFLGWTQKSDWMQVFAPGDEVECAKPNGVYKDESGTSPATALAAGIIAYFMGLGQSGADARLKLYDKAHPHRKNGLKVVWNDVDTRELSNDQVATTPIPTPAPAAPVPAYAEGTCSFHLIERRTKPPAQFSLPVFTVEVTLHDNAGTEIGHVDEQSASQTLAMTSQLELVLLIKTKDVQGGINFAYGDQSWNDGTNGDQLPNCKRGDWDVTDGGDKGNRQMDCYFECKH